MISGKRLKLVEPAFSTDNTVLPNTGSVADMKLLRRIIWEARQAASRKWNVSAVKKAPRLSAESTRPRHGEDIERGARPR